MLTVMKMPYLLENALKKIAGELCMNWMEQPPVWLLGGSCGQLLHGVKLSASPRDIDLYADLEDAGRLHEVLSRYAANGAPQEDFSGGCYSLRSRYVIGEAKVELICGFRIGAGKRQYSVDVHQLQQHAPIHEYTEIGLLRVMPAAHELVCNMLRGRIERCNALAVMMKDNLSAHMPLLQQLVLGNRLDESFQMKLDELLGISSSIQI